MKRLGIFAVLLLAEAGALAQGTIPGLTSTPITFSGHADAFVAGPDGNVWLIDATSNAIGRLAVDGSAYQAFTVPTPSAGLQSITVGPDGNLWFTETSAAQVGRITTSGTITEFPVPASFHFVYPVLVATGSIASGPDGNLWVSGQGQMAKVTPQGVVTVVTVPPPAGVFLLSIGKCVVGSDNNFWCESAGTDTAHHTAKLTTSGAVTLYDGQGQSFDFIKGPDGNVWYVSQQQPFIPPFTLTRITPAGVETVYALPTQRDCEGLAVGADGNIWFTERTTMGNLWQMILSSATDDGHATFNSAPISQGYPEGIIAVTSPAGPSGIHTNQAQSISCSGGIDFETFSSASYGSNVTRCETQAPATCTDMVAAGAPLRSELIKHTGWASCRVKKIDEETGFPNPAMAATLTIEAPIGADPEVENRLDWPECHTSGRDIICVAPQILPDQTLKMEFSFGGTFLDFLAPIRCRSTTFEMNEEDNDTSVDVVIAQPPGLSPPAKAFGRGPASQ